MKILITGSNGFIGSYFIEKYKKLYNINFFSFRKNKLENLIFDQIETIVHLSALVHQMGGATQEEYTNINVNQTLNLAKKAKNSGVKHFIFMSTVKVYGEETTDVYTEKSVCNPEDDYGKSKFKAEQELQKLEDENFKVSIIRTPIVYGYGVKANINNLISLVKKVPILPFSNIQNKRSMVYVGNLCHLIDTLIIKEKSGIYLAADDNLLSTTKLIELISKSLDKKVFLIKVPFFDNLLNKFKPSFYKRLYGSLEVNNVITKKALGLKNIYSVEEGINYMIHGEVL